MRQKAATSFRSESTGDTVSSGTRTQGAKARAELEEKVRSILVIAGESDYEDWQDSVFAQELAPLVRKYGEAAVKCVGEMVTRDGCGALVAGDALESLGRLHDPATSDARLRVLERGLSSKSVKIRAGAAFGLAYMGDARALPSLNRAIKKETSSTLREHMEHIRRRLEGNR